MPISWGPTSRSRSIALCWERSIPRPGPSPYLEALVAQGRLGMKSGEGFRKWTPEQQAELRRRVLRHLKAAQHDK